MKLKVEKNPITTTSTIALAISKTFLNRDTTKIFGFCKCHLQLKFSYMRHMQPQICVVA
jgi:hypothetical protein